MAEAAKPNVYSIAAHRGFADALVAGLVPRYADPELGLARLTLLLLVSHVRASNFRGKGDFHMDGRGRLTRRRSGRIAPFIFTGIQLIAKRLLRDAPQGPFSTNLLWTRAIEEGRLYGTAFTGEWFEVGDPQAIAPTEAALAGA